MNGEETCIRGIAVLKGAVITPRRNVQRILLSVSDCERCLVSSNQLFRAPVAQASAWAVRAA
jgi:hypothetical protein